MITFSNNSGKSIKDAIVIKGAKDSIKGIGAEWDYIGRLHGIYGADYQFAGQRLINELGGKVYDRIKIKLFPGGRMKTYFFDITLFFGK